MKSQVYEVGFPDANNADGNLINASDANKGCTYYCPYCSCSMHAKTSKLGTPFFAKIKGAQHTHKVCLAIEKTKKIYSFNASKKPLDMIAKLCHESPNRNKRGESASNNETHIVSGESEEVVVGTFKAFTSLKQIHEYLEFYHSPNEACGNGFVLSDYLLHYRWAWNLLSNPAYKLDARIIWTRYYKHDAEKNIIFFKIFGPNKFEKIFELKFGSKHKLFNEILNKVCVVTYNPVTYKREYISMEALIASTDWVYDPRSKCYNAYCFSSKQVYAFAKKEKDINKEPLN